MLSREHWLGTVSYWLGVADDTYDAYDAYDTSMTPYQQLCTVHSVCTRQYQCGQCLHTQVVDKARQENHFLKKKDELFSSGERTH